MQVQVSNGCVESVCFVDASFNTRSLIPSDNPHFVEVCLYRLLGYVCTRCGRSLVPDYYRVAPRHEIHAQGCNYCGIMVAREEKPDGSVAWWETFSTTPNPLIPRLFTNRDANPYVDVVSATVGRYLVVKWTPATAIGLYPLGLHVLSRMWSPQIVRSIIGATRIVDFGERINGAFWDGGWQFIDTTQIVTDRIDPRKFILMLKDAVPRLSDSLIDRWNVSLERGFAIHRSVLDALNHIGTEWAATPEILRTIKVLAKYLGLKMSPPFDKASWKREVEKDLGPFGPVDKILRRIA